MVALTMSTCALEACASHRPSERARAEHAAGTMVSVPGGTFRRHHGSGAFGELPTYVSVSAFLLDTTEVTVAGYAECVRAGRCEAAASTVQWEGISAADREVWSRYCNRDRDDRADHPVNCVEWDQAAAFCAWAGKRLPTEEEWEWAARNGREDTPHPWGEAAPSTQPCWSGESEGRVRGGTCTAGSHPEDVTRAGVRDLGGGVSEWTSSETVVGADSRGRGGTTVKVFRGGNWHDDDPWQVASTARSAADLRPRRDPRLGFRCASDR